MENKRTYLLIGISLLLVGFVLAVIFLVIPSKKQVSTAPIAAPEESAPVNAIANDPRLDSDNDGLTDVQEKIYRTDPNNPDSDKDGYPDGQEVANGYDPLKPAPGDKLVKEGECPPKKAKNPEELLRFASEAAAKNAREEVLCYFIPSVRQKYSSPLSNPAKMKDFGESLTRATQVEISDSKAMYKSSFTYENTQAGYYIYLSKESDGTWHFDAF